MKKRICSFLIIVNMIFLVACGSQSKNKEIDISKTMPAVESADKPVDIIAETGEPNQEADAVAEESKGKKDVDLTELSGTMAYAEIYNIMMEPEEYVGRKIKMKGQFAVYPDEPTGENRYAVIIADATACCAQGLMFVLAGEHTYPDDYPKQDAEVIVEGEFQLYDEAEYSYYHLVDAEILQE